MLAAIYDAEAESGRSLWIDAEALRPLDLAPQTIVRFQAGESDVERGIALFEQSRLLAIVRADIVLLTSSARGASYVNPFARSIHGIIYPLGPGPLAAQLREAGKRSDGLRFQTVEAWRTAPAGDNFAWSLADVGMQDDEAPAGA